MKLCPEEMAPDHPLDAVREVAGWEVTALEPDQLGIVSALIAELD